MVRGVYSRAKMASVFPNVYQPGCKAGFGKYQLLTARKSLAFSGSNQAQKGHLVDALAVRGDEGRDTLR